MKQPNTKAQITGEAVLWIYRFLLIGAVSLAVVLIVGSKYSDKYDIRSIESVLLSEKIVNCIENNPKITSDSLSSCLGMQNTNDYYISLNITSLDSGISRNITAGNSNLKVDCDILRQGTQFAKEPSCSNANYLVLLDNKKTRLAIETGIGKYDKNLR